MARVTVEDCIDKVNDRFELVLLAGQRAKNIASGEPLTIDRNNEKNTVLSLREIAATKISTDVLRENLIRNNQRIRIEEEETSANDEDQGMASEAMREIKELAVVDEESLEDSHSEEKTGDKDYSFDEDNVEVND